MLLQLPCLLLQEDVSLFQSDLLELTAADREMIPIHKFPRAFPLEIPTTYIIARDIPPPRIIAPRTFPRQFPPAYLQGSFLVPTLIRFYAFFFLKIVLICGAYEILS